MDLDLDAIELRAKAATPGPWKAHQDRQWGVVRKGDVTSSVSGPSTNPSIPSPDVVCSMHFSDRYIRDDGANAAHIAGLDPLTVLALVARAREAGRLEEEVDCHATEEDGWEHDLMQERARASAAETEAARLRTELATAARMRDCMPMGAEGLLVTQEHYDGLAKQADDLCNFYNSMFIALGFDRPQPATDLVAAVARLRPVVEKLRKGLEPFGAFAAAYANANRRISKKPDVCVIAMSSTSVFVGDFDNAARLLAETAPDVPADQDGRAQFS